MSREETRRLLNLLRSALGLAIVVLLVFLTSGPDVGAQHENAVIPPGTYDHVRPEPEMRQQRPERPRQARPAPEAEAAAPTEEIEISARVLVLGDSLAHNLGSGLETVLSDAPEIAVETQAQGSSGIVRDDFYDWPAAIEAALSEGEKVDIGVIMIGLNDRQPLRVDGESAPPLSDPWREEYARRIDAMITSFRDRDIPLVWVGLPPTESARLSTDLAAINEIVRERARHGGAYFVDIWKGFVDEEDRYAASGPDLSGQNARLRASDGIHFTPAGAAKAAHFADVEIRRLVSRPGEERVAISRAAIEAVDDPQLRDEAIDMLIRRSLGELPAFPGLEYVPSRPAIGPLLPLTRIDIAPGGALLSGRPRVDPATRIITERALEEGIAPSPASGRADDFRWPRSE